MYGLPRLTAAGFNPCWGRNSWVLPFSAWLWMPAFSGRSFQKLWGDKETAFKCPSWAGKGRRCNLLGVCQALLRFLCLIQQAVYSRGPNLSGLRKDKWSLAEVNSPPSPKNLFRISFWKLIISKKLNMKTTLYVDDKAIQTHPGPTFYLVHPLSNTVKKWVPARQVSQGPGWLALLVSYGMVWFLLDIYAWGPFI